MPKPNISFYVTLVLIAVAISYLIISKSELRKKGILLNAKTKTWVPLAQGSLNLQYDFTYKGKVIKGNNAFNDFRGDPDFENRYFPVIYYPGLGGHSQLLIRPSDFKKFDLPFPDSLNWVLPYLK